VTNNIKINKFLIIIILFLVSCQRQVILDIDTIKSEYLMEAYEAYINQKNILDHTVLIKLQNESETIIGHGVLIQIEKTMYVLTNYHVIYTYQETSQLTMYIKDQEILGQVIYDDPTFDLAFIAIDVEDTFNHVVIDLSLKMEVNEIVQSTRKFNNDSKIVFGTILDFDRVPIIDGNPLISDVTFPVFSIQLESEYGISGSPVYNMDYEFIGITYAVNLQKNALSRVYVIPIEDIQVFIYNFLDQ